MQLFNNRKVTFKGRHNKIHLNFSLALLLGLIVFVSGIETATDNEVSIILMYSVCMSFLTYNNNIIRIIVQNPKSFISLIRYFVLYRKQKSWISIFLCLFTTIHFKRVNYVFTHHESYIHMYIKSQ